MGQLTAQDIEPGTSYACKYRDLAGDECVAIIVKRDSEQELLALQDLATGMEMVLSYGDVWDIDTVEWTDDEQT